MSYPGWSEMMGHLVHVISTATLGTGNPRHTDEVAHFKQKLRDLYSAIEDCSVPEWVEHPMLTMAKQGHTPFMARPIVFIPKTDGIGSYGASGGGSHGGTKTFGAP